MNGKIYFLFFVVGGAISLFYLWWTSSGCASKSVNVKGCHICMPRRVSAHNVHNYYGVCVIVLQSRQYPLIFVLFFAVVTQESVHEIWVQNNLADNFFDVTNVINVLTEPRSLF